MTKRERTYIEEKAKQFEAWAQQERMAAKTSGDPEERGKHYRQEALNDACCNVLYNLLTELLEGV